MIRHATLLLPTVVLSLWLLGPRTAAAGAWETDPASTLRFRAVQQQAPFEGRFRSFAAEIDFDPAAPAAGQIRATIDLGSVDTDYEDRDNYLRDQEWFFTERFPAATYVAQDIEATDSGFVARGELELRGVTRPVALRFSFEQTADQARLVGSAELLRLDFKVGIGDWTDTQWVANEVTVLVDLQLTRPATYQGL